MSHVHPTCKQGPRPHLLRVHGDALGGGQLLQPIRVLADTPLLLPRIHLLLWGQRSGQANRHVGPNTAAWCVCQGGGAQGAAATPAKLHPYGSQMVRERPNRLTCCAAEACTCTALMQPST